jgi:hypothetical protein
VFSCRLAIVLVIVLSSVALVAQVPARVRSLQPVAEPSVPSDPLELVRGDAQPVQDVNQRADIINLVLNAHRHSNVRTQPYDLKTTFIASGSSSSDGVWQLEDTSPSAGLYRWTAQGPNFSVVNLHANRVLYSNQPAISLPLRLVQVREAIFYSEPMLGPRASLRTASGSVNGVEVVCALIARNAPPSGQVGGRRWEEEEYCVDPKAGTMITYSLVPGLYVRYDYSKALQFHGKLIANKFTITQAGRTVVEAQTESVTDPPNNPAAFQTAGLNQIGVGPIMSAPWRFRSMRPLPAGAPGGTAQIVVLHGMQSPDGQIADVELLASSDTSLNDPALAIASKWVGGMMGQEPEPGATPQSHEILMTIQYSQQ